MQLMFEVNEYKTEKNKQGKLKTMKLGKIVKKIIAEIINWGEENPSKFTNQLKKITGDNTLSFDDYDDNGYPLYISKKNEEVEYWIDEKGIVFKGDGRSDSKVGKVK